MKKLKENVDKLFNDFIITDDDVVKYYKKFNEYYDLNNEVKCNKYYNKLLKLYNKMPKEEDKQLNKIKRDIRELLAKAARRDFKILKDVNKVFDRYKTEEVKNIIMSGFVGLNHREKALGIYDDIVDELKGIFSKWYGISSAVSNTSKVVIGSINAFSDIVGSAYDKDEEKPKSDLEDWQQELVDSGDYNPEDFTEGEDGPLEDDDYYYEDGE